MSLKEPVATSAAGHTGPDQEGDRPRDRLGQPDDGGGDDAEPGGRREHRDRHRRGDRAHQHLRGALRLEHDELDMIVRNLAQVEHEAADAVAPAARRARGSAGCRCGGREGVGGRGHG